MGTAFHFHVVFVSVIQTAHVASVNVNCGPERERELRRLNTNVCYAMSTAFHFHVEFQRVLQVEQEFSGISEK